MAFNGQVQELYIKAKICIQSYLLKKKGLFHQNNSMEYYMDIDLLSETRLIFYLVDLLTATGKPMKSYYSRNL